MVSANKKEISSLLFVYVRKATSPPWYINRLLLPPPSLSPLNHLTSIKAMVIGAVAAQEAIKGVTGMFSPLKGFSYFDAKEVLDPDILALAKNSPSECIAALTEVCRFPLHLTN